MKILVVDDDDFVRTVMAQTLSKAGHDIDESACGNDALKKLQENVYDVVVTDIVMPDQSGATIGDYVKNNHLPTAVLAVSAHSRKGEALEFANYFADDTLKKPFRKEDLLRAVEGLSHGNDIEAAMLNL
ncbi:MAG TPA: response regulator [Alphaproteobacteria bacterium]|nr:response regulator [Alphaproteobacteria bacterium]